MSSTALTTLLTAAVLVGGLWLWQRDMRARIRRHLDDPDDRDRYIRELRQDHFEDADGTGAESHYRARTRRALDRIASVLGERYFFSLHGFGLCLTLAVGYAVLLFWSSWLLGVSSELPALSPLPHVDTLAPWRRLLIAAATGMLLGAAAFGLRAATRSTGARRWVAGLCTAGLVVVGYLATHLLALGWVMPSLVQHTSIGLSAIYGAMATTALLLALAASGFPRAAGRFAVTLWSIVAIVYVALPANTVESIIALLVLVLPITNAAFDWLSWAISRRLIADLTRPDVPATVRRLVSHIGWDLLAALLLLVGLTVTIPWILERFAVGFATDEIFREAAADPFGQGRWLVVMLISTLMPTALHVGALLASATELRRGRARREQVAALLDDPLGTPSPRRLDDAAGFLANRWRLPVAVQATALLVCFGPLLWLGPLGRMFLGLGEAVGAATRSEAGWGAIARVRIRRLQWPWSDTVLDGVMQALRASGDGADPSVRELGALVMSRAKRSDDALWMLDQLLQAGHLTPRACRDLAGEIGRSGGWRLAALASCQLTWPDDPVLGKDLSSFVVWLVTGQMQQDVDQIERLRSVQPGRGGRRLADALDTIAWDLLEHGAIDVPDRGLVAARQLGLDRAVIHALQGGDYNRRRRHAAAAEVLRLAAAREPWRAAIWRELARACHHLGDLHGASEALGHLLAVSHESDADIECFAQHVVSGEASPPDCVSALLDGARALSTRAGCIAHAEAERSGTSAPPERSAPPAGRALRERRIDRVVRCLDTWPEERALQTVFAAQALHLPEYRDACIEMRRTIAADMPDEPGHWIAVGDGLLEIQHYDEALTAYDEALARAPDAWRAWSGRGRAHLGARRFRDALRDLERSARHLAVVPGREWPGHAQGDLWRSLASAQLALGRIEAAWKVILMPSAIRGRGRCVLAHIKARKAGQPPPDCDYLPPPPAE